MRRTRAQESCSEDFAEIWSRDWVSYFPVRACSQDHLMRSLWVLTLLQQLYNQHGLLSFLAFLLPPIPHVSQCLIPHIPTTVPYIFGRNHVSNHIFSFSCFRGPRRCTIKAWSSTTSRSICGPKTRRVQPPALHCQRRVVWDGCR